MPDPTEPKPPDPTAGLRHPYLTPPERMLAAAHRLDRLTMNPDVQSVIHGPILMVFRQLATVLRHMSRRHREDELACTVCPPLVIADILLGNPVQRSHP
jgi:hypothetical protein